MPMTPRSTSTREATTRPRAARWREPEVTDSAAFAASHPETVVTPELWARLEPEIRRRAALLEFDPDPDTQAELQAELRARIIEAARGFRVTGADGEPVFDYLAQHPRYVVWHAAGRIYTSLRRDRRERKVTDRIELLGGYDEWGDPMPADVVDPSTFGSPSASLEHAQLYTGIAARLFPAQRRVLELLEEGLDRGEIGERLGISRKTVHDHINAIRAAALAEIGDDSHTSALVADRHAVRRPSRRLSLQARPATETRTAARPPRVRQQPSGSARRARTR